MYRCLAGFFLWAFLSLTSAWAQPFGGFNLSGANLSASISFINAVAINSAATTYNFTSSLGSNPSPGRDIIVGLCDSATGAPSVSSVTINGVSASQQVTAASSFNRASFWTANVPTGTTGVTITAVLGSAALRAAISVYATQNQQSLTATASASSTTNGGTMTLSSILAGGVAVAMSCDNSATSSTWSNLTKDTDTQYGVTTLSSASEAFAGAQTSYGVSDTEAAATGPVFAAASFR